MKKGNTVKIDYSRTRLAMQADKCYNEGKYLSALRFAYKELELYGGDADVFVRLSDIYEGMGLHASAINWWYRFLDIAEEQDLPDIYEGLAVNYLNLGEESSSAYYYNKLIDTDDGMPIETKLEIARAFSKEKKEDFRFVYPPEAADYTKELDAGSRALKSGDFKRALAILSRVAKGSKEYASAQEMKAVAYLLAGELEESQKICEEGLEESPNDCRLAATLAAVYLEQGKTEESRALAYRLCSQEQKDVDDLYKVATVCCENGMHEIAYQKFKQLEEKIPYDGRMLYFKAVAAYKCGKLQEAETTLDTLCTLYPDAEVAKYYLKEMRLQRAGEGEMTEPTYFYHLPKEEREQRCHSLLHIGSCPRDEAQMFGLLALHDGYFRWCFDEMDGSDHELQYLGIVTANHVRADEFLREVLLDSEVLDALKVEALRLLYERNEQGTYGVVLYNIYRKVHTLRINVGRKKNRRFVEAYARIASKFAMIRPEYGPRIHRTTERLYYALEKNGCLDLVENSDDCACAIFILSKIKDLSGGFETIVEAFEGNPEKVRVLLAAAEEREEEPVAENKEKTEK